jgi:hypothetical protein
MRVTERQLRRIIVEAIKRAELMEAEEKYIQPPAAEDIFLQLSENLRVITEYYLHFDSLIDDNNSIENHSDDLGDRAQEAITNIENVLSKVTQASPYIDSSARSQLRRDAKEIAYGIYSMQTTLDDYKTWSGTHDDPEKAAGMKGQEDPKKVDRLMSQLRKTKGKGMEILEKFKADLAMATKFHNHPFFDASTDPRVLRNARLWGSRSR